MDCIRVGIVYEAFYIDYVEPKKDLATRWASLLDSLRNKAAMTPQELIDLLDRAWAWGCRFYDTHHGAGEGQKGSCYEILKRLFQEAETVYLREKDTMPKDMATQLERRVRHSVSRDPKVKKS